MRPRSLLGALVLALACTACGKSKGANDAGTNTNDGGTLCGNGVLEDGEQCDNGPANSDDDPNACRTNCFLAACGDGTIDTGEECDDGITANSDTEPGACRTTCLAASCGDAVVDAPSESCDLGPDGRSQDGCSSGCLVEDPTWVEHTSPVPGDRWAATLVYDSLRQRTVLYGGGDGTFLRYGDTFEYDAAIRRWLKREPATSPPGRIGHAAAFDSARGVTVVFGGEVGPATVVDETWEWNGIDWTQATPANSPPARWGFSMAYDSANGVTVLFGGADLGVDLGDTWEYDGIDWVETTPVPSPSARWTMSMTFDSARSRVLLFGGQAGPTHLNDTWEYDAATGQWQDRSPATRPPARRTGAMAYDPAGDRTILFGGLLDPTVLGDTWHWNGVAGVWTPLAPLTPPPALAAPAMSFHASDARFILFGGHDGTAVTGHTWELDGAAWSEVIIDFPTPRVSHGLTMDSLRQRFVVFGGEDTTGFLGDTWELDPDTFVWNRVTTGGAPSPRGGLALLYARGADRVVLFGGDDGALRGDTWHYDGALATWTDVTPSPSPSGRQGMGIAYDSDRDRIVLFGGNDANGIIDDTWEYDPIGISWSQLSPAGAPGPRTFTTMAYAPSVARFVLFGGFDGNELGDTWEYDPVAQTWTEIVPAISPPERSVARLVWHAARQRIVLFSGDQLGTRQDDVWEYDPLTGTWEDRTPPSRPQARHGFGVAYDNIARRIVTFGGLLAGDVHTDDLWSYRFASATPDEVCDDAGDQDGDGLIDCADPDCAGQHPACP